MCKPPLPTEETQNATLPDTSAPLKSNGADQLAPTGKRKGRKRLRIIEVALLSISLCILLMLGLLLGALASIGGGVQSLFQTSGVRNNPPAGSYSVIRIEGTIQESSSTYQHSATVAYIKAMMEDEGNLGLLLYLNTGGGGVYESDEVYRTLMRYKEQTGRPVWAYMGKSCASGGYYIAAAADKIFANPGTTTGSIGVYYQLTDLSRLYSMLGVETVLIRSGSNKGVGVEGVEITQENREVYQSMVDESYNTFVGIVAASRGYTDTQARAIADGRPYTALQALNNGLVDELAEYEDVTQQFDTLCDGTAYNTNFIATSTVQQLIGNIFSGENTGETQALLELAESQQNGLMAMAEGLS